MSQSVIKINKTESQTTVKNVEKTVIRAEWSREEWVEQHYETWKAQNRQTRRSDFIKRQASIQKMTEIFKKIFFKQKNLTYGASIGVKRKNKEDEKNTINFAKIVKEQ